MKKLTIREEKCLRIAAGGGIVSQRCGLLGEIWLLAETLALAGRGKTLHGRHTGALGVETNLSRVW